MSNKQKKTKKSKKMSEKEWQKKLDVLSKDIDDLKRLIDTEIKKLASPGVSVIPSILYSDTTGSKKPVQTFMICHCALPSMHPGACEQCPRRLGQEFPNTVYTNQVTTVGDGVSAVVAHG